MKEKESFELVKGTFTGSEAMDIVQALFDQKINFHKLQRLSWYEGNVHADTRFPDGRIAELMLDKERARKFLMSLATDGQRFRIEGRITIETLGE